MPSVNGLLDGNRVDLVRAAVKALAQAVVVGVAGAGTAYIHFTLGNDAATGNDQNKQGFHGGGFRL